ncbi:MAG: hypothetical protein WAT79_16105 [Saprospiraceae bacterium]
MIYLTIKTKSDNKVFTPIPICSDYYLSMFLASKSIESFTIFDMTSEERLIPPNFNHEQIKKLRPNGIIDPDMQNFYKSQPEFLEELKCGIAFDWIAGIRVYNDTFAKYEQWLNPRELELIIEELTNFFHKNIKTKSELQSALYCSLKISGAIIALKSLFDEIEIAFCDGE